MNKDLLFQLYAIHSPSGGEKKMRRFLRKQAKDYGADTIVTDNYGNLLITKGLSETYPCLAAHMDQVQHAHSKDFRVIEIDDDVIGWSPKCHEQQGLGADDKNGIFICLELLRKFDVMKVAFFVGEETGCQGSSRVDLGFFKDCRFIVEPDRKGGHDLITSMFCGDVCSEEFTKAIGYEQYGYKPDHGSITDVGELVERGVGISCLNLSCGYYEAHTDHELTVLSELRNCMDFVEHIVTTCTDVYPYEYDAYESRWSGYYSSLYGGGYGKYGKKKSYNSYYKEYNDWEDEDAYYSEGWYEDDYAQMEEYLQVQPDLSFDTIKRNYMGYFNAALFFDQSRSEGVLADIYTDIKDGKTDVRNIIDDDEGEIVFTPTKKVS